MTAARHGPDGCSNACCLDIQKLSVTQGETRILWDVGLHLHCGEICAVIGPNGAGKSTLFRAILGQLPHEGEIFFERSDGERMSPRIGYVPQSPRFAPGEPVSVLDFFAASISRYPVFLPLPHALRERVHDCLARVHAQALINRRVGALSGGELQRMLLAMALEPLPNILILDEPFSGVDVEGMQLLMELLHELRSTYDLSILFSTHDFTALSEHADKALLLCGTVRRVGKPSAVLASPEFREVFRLSAKPEGGGTL